MGLTDKHLAYGDDIPQTQAEKDYYWKIKNLEEKQQVFKKGTDTTTQEIVEVVIRLPKNIYKTLEKFKENGVELGVCETAILNGIQLPKGHGDLKDIAEIERLWQKGDCDSIASALIFAPTIVEADKEVFNHE